uniref:Uncharacterized protein n=1 Tax=Rhizophora mucronata TaxID=61149 RepID=A0A2P2IL85_RHIMU
MFGAMEEQGISSCRVCVRRIFKTPAREVDTDCCRAFQWEDQYLGEQCWHSHPETSYRVHSRRLLEANEYQS